MVLNFYKNMVLSPDLPHPTPKKIVQMNDRLPDVAKAADQLQKIWEDAGVPTDDIIRMRADLLARAANPRVPTWAVEPVVETAAILSLQEQSSIPLENNTPVDNTLPLDSNARKIPNEQVIFNWGGKKNQLDQKATSLAEINGKKRKGPGRHSGRTI